MLLSMSSPYRLQRLTTFLDPWADPYNTGYQLIQSLIAFGRGGLLGEGLGASIQKLHFLPEPHTDFLFAVLSEELGLFGGMIVLGLFFCFILKLILIARAAMAKKALFSGFVTYGIALWVGFQTVVNIGVNTGLLPTKGLTLPLMSYGGSSMVVMLVAMGIVCRVDFENKA